MHCNFDETIRIGVVIVYYNNPQYLLKTLTALSMQILKPVQVILWDNASTSLIPSEALALDLPLTVIRSPANLGFAKANNQAITALGDDINWVALLNPDAYPHPDWLLQMAKAISSNPDYAFWGCQLICDDNPQLLDGTGDCYHISGKAWRANHQKPLVHGPKDIKEIFSPCAAAALYSRACWTDAAGFDAHFFCYYEDVDLAFRLWLLGYRGAYAPLARVAHTGSASTTRYSDFYTYHGHRNLVWTYLKNMPLALLIVSLPLHVLLNLASIALFIYRRQLPPLLRAKKDALRALPRILKQRRLIQKNRTLPLFKLLSILKLGVPWSK